MILLRPCFLARYRAVFAAMLFLASASDGLAGPGERELPLAKLRNDPTSFRADADPSGGLTWWLPPGPDTFVLPISAGVVVDTSHRAQMDWLRRGSPWGLAQLPAFGARYGNRTLVVIVPWPHYAELVVEDRIGVRFSLPKGRRNAAPCDVVALWRRPDPLEVALAFREWRSSAKDTGGIPHPRPLARKARELSHVARLYGAPHFYLWGDGVSVPTLNALHGAGLDRALLLLSDLYGKMPRPDVARRAVELGFLFGPYDSYHSVHSPNADPDETWETAQFDRAAYERGRVLNSDGTGHAGFRGAGYHFSPLAAWPYVRKRVGGLLRQAPYSAWFIDCDATAECFDDYHPERHASRVDDIKARRKRLRWLESEHRLVVGSEDGSVLFADTLHFGHGLQTPYIGHLDPAFREPKSAHFLGRHWPPDTPENAFKPVSVPPSLVTPYFDPRVRIPLVQAALGDELIVSHHWSFDSLKFEDVAVTRELFELLYNVAPMYHLSRASWPKRRDRIVRHAAFWGPIHRQLAEAPLTRFNWLSKDRLLQRTTFRSARGDVTITVNFDGESRQGYPACSATVAGPIEVPQRIYRAQKL
jgi:hypothetical protein